MSTRQKSAQVAVSGPLRRSYSYLIPRDWPELAIGQRLLIPFGGKNRVGFFLGEASPDSGIELKPAGKIIDKSPLIDEELARFCIWMADYYFANPADCLTVALPTQLKKNRSVRFSWTGKTVPMMPDAVTRLARPGRALSRLAFERINRVGSEYLKRLLADGVVVETVDDGSDKSRQNLKGYHVVDQDKWEELFGYAKEKLSPFIGIRSSSEMREYGVTDHYRRKAISQKIIEPVYESGEREILEFVQPKTGLEELKLTVQQQAVTDEIKSKFGSGFAPFLLHGITGSGKTLVYCHLAQEIIDSGRTVLVLTPEIALSSNTLAYFRGIFGQKATVMHSAMSPAERLASWQGIREGRFQIVVGPRSALFAPLGDLGLIIVDEEHDPSYKQNEPAPRFHGRDAAVMRASMMNIPIVLGSASPSVESFYNAKTGRYKLLRLTKRPANAKLPTVSVIDMRKQKLSGDAYSISFPLKKEVDANLSDGRQVILYLNRRGYAPSIQCSECGAVPECTDCKVRLTYHKNGNRLACHYCGKIESYAGNCAKCGGDRLLHKGTGTQRVEEFVGTLFSTARPVRMDSDSASGRLKAYRILSEFAQEKYNLLLGTQMVTKGLDLPKVSLVGVLSADMGLDMPDFRASEKTFARLLQVSGRSGRSTHPGKVLIQTYDPERPLIAEASRQDYDAFYDRTIIQRKELDYPPFTRLVRIVFSSETEDQLPLAANQFRDQLLEQIESTKLQAKLMGPAPCAFTRLRGRYRRHLIVKVKPAEAKLFSRLLTAWEERATSFGLPKDIRVAVDVDPVDMM
ncbi:MAG: primosomal protein N' [candidate division Zixibacteria bacterium]